MGPELLRVSWSLLKPLPDGSWGVLKWGSTAPLKTPSPSPPILRWWVMRYRYLCQETMSLASFLLVLDSLLLLNLTNHSGTRKPNPKLPVYKSYHQNGRLFIIKIPSPCPFISIHSQHLFQNPDQITPSSKDFTWFCKKLYYCYLLGSYSILPFTLSHPSKYLMSRLPGKIVIRTLLRIVYIDLMNMHISSIHSTLLRI